MVLIGVHSRELDWREGRRDGIPSRRVNRYLFTKQTWESGGELPILINIIQTNRTFKHDLIKAALFWPDFGFSISSVNF